MELLPNMTSVPCGSTIVTRRPSVAPPTDSRMRSNRPRSCATSDTTSSAPSSKVPPPAPSAADQRGHFRAAQMRELDRKAADSARGAGDETRRPRMAGPSRRMRSAVRPAVGSAAPGRRRRYRAARQSSRAGPPPARPRPRPAGCRPLGHRPAGRARRRTAGCRRSPSRAPAVGSGPEHPQLAPIDRERPHLHEHLAGRRHRLGNVGKAILPGAELSATSARIGQASGLWSLTTRSLASLPSNDGT